MQKLPCEAISQVLAWNCRAKAALRSYCLSFCVELSCKSCLLRLFLRLSYGTVVQKLPFEATSHAFAWNCHAKVTLRSYFLSFYMKLSCRSCLTKLFLKLLHDTVTQKLPCELLHATVVQKLPFGATSKAFAWNCYANVFFRSYPSSLSSSMELSSKNCLAKLSLEIKYRSVFPSCSSVLLNNGRGLGRSLSCVGRNRIRLFMILHGTVVHKFLAELSLKLLHGTVVQKLSYGAISWTFACNCRAEAPLQNYFLSFCMELSYKSCLANRFLKLLHGAVVQKMPFEAIFAGSCVALSCKSCLLKLLLQFFVWSCHAKVT